MGNMPVVGETQIGKAIGFKSNSVHIYAACMECGKERWVPLRKGKPESLRCRPCGTKGNGPKGRGPGNPRWNGGRSVTIAGYIELWIDSSSQFFPMAGKEGYILEHRLVMAQHIGRCLTSDEDVHHVNENKKDNRIENLELLSRNEHMQRHSQEMSVLVRRLANLERENRELKEKLHG